MRNSTLCCLLALGFVVAPLVAPAGDHPAEGDKLVIKDPGDASKRRFRFTVARDPAIDPAIGDDPTLVGASLEVTGAGAGDGSTGTLDLMASSWDGLGNPPGSRGYRFTDKAAAMGVKRVVFKSGGSGGSLKVKGGGENFPYVVTQAQGGPVDVRFTIGADTFCSRFDAFVKNEPGRVKAKNAPAPGDCAPVSVTCGDGVLDALEECDDGNTESGDGCSSACALEDASALCAGVPTAAGTALDTELVVSGIVQPTDLQSAPLDPNRLFAVQQNGKIVVIKNGVALPTFFLDIQSKVSCCSERGLLGMVFHPDYASNGYFFVNYTDTAGDTVIARYQVSANPDVADAGSELVLLNVSQDFANHNGGQLAFGPDGFLYVGLGDGGSGGDPNERAQDPGTLLGKMLRLDVDQVGPPWGAASNPFYDGGLSDPRDEIWALGLRNPWRFSFDGLTGDLYMADVGQNDWEEVNVQPAASTGGENYGWDVFEGDGHCFEGDAECAAPESFVMPVLEYPHTQGCSISGGPVYRGCAMPDLHGTYFYADFCTAFIRTFQGVVGGVAQNQQDRTADLAPGGGLSIGTVAAFGQDARGEIYIVDRSGGEIFKIVPGS
jgi:cysteine-rich repeat protein